MKMIGRRGTAGQCQCCNDTVPPRVMRKREAREWRRDQEV